jgi:HEPN domain-containing protein
MLLNQIATDDYIASRCCLLNGLLSQGYILAEQAVEKELKSILLLLLPKENLRDRKKFRQHVINDLINRIHEISSLNLSSFKYLGEVLSDIYELTRYPDNRLRASKSSWSMTSAVVDDLDEMFFSLVEESPMPKEVKFRSGIYVLAFDNQDPNSSTQYWALLDNKAFASRLFELEGTFKNVMNHLYPAE